MPARIAISAFTLLLTFSAFALGQVHQPPLIPGRKSTAHAPSLTAGEARATRAFEAAKALGAPELYAFLRGFPKGGDLHMHLSGAIYAETFIKEAAEQGLCVAPAPPACAIGASLEGKQTQTPSSGTTGQVSGCPASVLDPKSPLLPLSFVSSRPDKTCAFGQIPAGEALKTQQLYDGLVDSFSMRGYVPQEGVTGHDQFFATFARFGGVKNVSGEWLDEVATRAAAQNEQYLEIMNTPMFSHAAALGYKLGWHYDDDHDTHMQSFASLRTQLLAAGLRDEVELDRTEFADALAKQRQGEGCSEGATAFDPKQGQPSLRGRDPRLVSYAADLVSTPCSVQIRFLYQVLRAFPPQQVFAQTLLGFEVAQAELDSGHPLVVGINFVQPEDAHLAMQDYHLQMLMLDFFHSVYPRVRISLHAGELAFGMVPPEGLSFHIREAVELGHAERIGHGMDVLYETNANDLLKEMASKHVMVEVNLTSNDVILGKTRTDHPIAAYRAAHVPLALSTDDEGVSRIDLTHEYVKAAEEQHLTYADLKRSARTSLEHSFLEGASLWASLDEFTLPAAGCALPVTASDQPRLSCQTLFKTSNRAELQWELERRLVQFEGSIPSRLAE